MKPERFSDHACSQLGERFLGKSVHKLRVRKSCMSTVPLRRVETVQHMVTVGTLAPDSTLLSFPLAEQHHYC